MEILAPAKINFVLKIVNKRKDGYHNIFSVFQTISLFDKIEVVSIKTKKIIIKSNTPSINGKKNICYKIAKYFIENYNLNSGIKIIIDKKIPIGSGLGGASSNAAAVAKAIVDMFKLKIAKNKLKNICAKIGKDIPFFFHKGCCVVQSTGEKIKVIHNPPWKLKPLKILLVYPNINLSTKLVYETYDKHNHCIYNNKTNRKNILKYIKKNKLIEILHNDLEKASIFLYPNLLKLKDFLIKNCGNANMTGSGSCFYSIINGLIDEKKLLLKTKRQFKNYKIFIVKTYFDENKEV